MQSSRPWTLVGLGNSGNGEPPFGARADGAQSQRFVPSLVAGPAQAHANGGKKSSQKPPTEDTEHWGDEVELVNDDDEGKDQARPSDDNTEGAARTSRPTTTADRGQSECSEPRHRRALDSPSSLDNDD